MNVAETLFTIREIPSVKSSDTIKNCTPEERILLYPQNLFHLSAMTGTNPITKTTGIFKNRRYQFDHAIVELKKLELIAVDKFCLDSLHRARDTFWKAPPPTTQPQREEFIRKLGKFKVDITEYENVYKLSSTSDSMSLSPLGIQHFYNCAQLVPEYFKYEADLKLVIHQHLEAGNIVQVSASDDTINYAISASSSFFSSGAGQIGFFPVPTWSNMKKEQWKQSQTQQQKESRATAPSSSNANSFVSLNRQSSVPLALSSLLNQQGPTSSSASCSSTTQGPFSLTTTSTLDEANNVGFLQMQQLFFDFLQMTPEEKQDCFRL
ncbi:unnamed protein product, partial [Didymodactylos carnosus]